MDMGTAEKADTQAEREVTRNRRALIHPSSEHALVTGGNVCLAPPEGECPPSRRDPDRDAKLGTPYFLAAL